MNFQTKTLALCGILLYDMFNAGDVDYQMALDFSHKERYDIHDLLEIMRLLRSPDGCPWDREQTHRSIRGDFLEETHEVIEAIDRNDRDGLQEELGDVLLQVVFHARIEEEENGFTFDDVVDTLCQKLVIRHPHVFGDNTAGDAGEALKNWDAIKRQTKNGKTQAQLLDGVPHSLPSLMRTGKVLGRARRVGFETVSTPQEALVAFEQQVEILKRCISNGEEADVAMGDMLFAAVALSRQLHIDPEEQLSLSANRFIDRFSAMEQAIKNGGGDISSVSAEEWQKRWEQTAPK